MPIVALDSELIKLGIKNVDFIKMDIEGAEMETIRGCQNILLRDDVNLAIASYHLVNGKKTCFKVERLLKEMGFKTKTAFPEHLTTYATKNQSTYLI